MFRGDGLAKLTCGATCGLRTCAEVVEACWEPNSWHWRVSDSAIWETLGGTCLASIWLSGCKYCFSTQRHLGSVVDSGDRLPDRNLRLYFSCKNRNRQSWNVLSWAVQHCPVGAAKLKTHRKAGWPKDFRVERIDIDACVKCECVRVRWVEHLEYLRAPGILSDNCAWWAWSTFTSQSKRESGCDEIRQWWPPDPLLNMNLSWADAAPLSGVAKQATPPKKGTSAIFTKGLQWNRILFWFLLEVAYFRASISGDSLTKCMWWV